MFLPFLEYHKSCFVSLLIEWRWLLVEILRRDDWLPEKIQNVICVKYVSQSYKLLICFSFLLESSSFLSLISLPNICFLVSASFLLYTVFKLHYLLIDLFNHLNGMYFKVMVVINYWAGSFVVRIKAWGWLFQKFGIKSIVFKSSAYKLNKGLTSILGNQPLKNSREVS